VWLNGAGQVIYVVLWDRERGPRSAFKEIETLQA